MYYWNAPLRVTQWELPACVDTDDDEIQDEQVEEQAEEAPLRFPPSFRPYRVCRYVLMGHVCPYGDQCTFAHEMSELHPERHA